MPATIARQRPLEESAQLKANVELEDELQRPNASANVDAFATTYLGLL